MLPGTVHKGSTNAIEKSKRKAQQNTERRDDMPTQSYCPPSLSCGVDKGAMLLDAARSPEALERIVSCPSG